LDNTLISLEPEHADGEGELHRWERLGGLLNYYCSCLRITPSLDGDRWCPMDGCT
jgi:hypothetical protein